MKHRNPSHKLWLSAIAAGVLGLVQQAQAQDQAPQAPQPAPAPQAAAPERIEVTGSSIKHLATEAASSVTTVKAEEFAQRGITTLADVMMTLPQSLSLTPSNAGAGSNINLRGLGVNRTLVLVDGRRLANEPTADGFANIDVVPMSALSRIEVLNDGASSIYGSDAIGGVVNFLTKRSYEGAGITGQVVQPQRSGGGVEHRGSFIVGKGNLAADGWNVYGTVDYHDRSRLAASDRAFLTSSDVLTALGRPPSLATGTYAFPANVISTTTKVAYNPYFSTGCDAPYSIPGAKGTCVLNPNQYNTALYGNAQLTLFTRGTLKLSEDHQLRIDYMRGQEYIDSVRNPATSAVITTVSPSTAAAVITPASSKWYPGGAGGVPAIAALKGEPLTVEYSSPTLAGTRDQQINQRLVVNDEGRVAGWDYKAGLDLGISNRNIMLHQGILDGVKLNAGISNGTINPFGAQDAAGQAYLDSISLNNDQLLRAAKSSFTGIDATVNRELMTLPGGPLSLALGADVHRDTDHDVKEAIGTYAAPVAATPTLSDSARTVNAVFAEIEVPLTKKLTLDFAVRDDHFSDVGNTVNPKATIRFQPNKMVLFRGALSTGFRAPTLSDRYGYRVAGANTTTSVPMDDPVLCPSATPNIAGTGKPLPGYSASVVCNVKQPKQTGSNPNLVPEKSKNMTFGIVVEPVTNATVSLDYWKVSMTNMLASLPESAYTSDPLKYLNLFVRNPDGSLAYIMNDTTNLGGQKVAGIDVSASYQLPKSPAGVFTLGLDGTYLTEFDNQIDKGGPWVSNIGNFGLASNGTTSSFPVLSFRWRHNLRLSWAYGDWTSQLTESYNSHYLDQNTTTVPSANNHVIPAYSLLNWTVSYKGFKHWTIVGAVNNVLDAMPPPTNHSAYTGYLSSAASPIGRAYGLTVSYEF